MDEIEKEEEQIQQAFWLSEVLPWIFNVALLCYTYLVATKVISLDNTWWLLLFFIF